MSDALSHLPELLTTDQLCDFLQIDKGTLFQMNSKGRAPVRIKIGRQVRYARTDVLAWLEARRVSA